MLAAGSCPCKQPLRRAGCTSLLHSRTRHVSFAPTAFLRATTQALAALEHMAGSCNYHTLLPKQYLDLWRELGQVRHVLGGEGVGVSVGGRVSVWCMWNLVGSLASRCGGSWEQAVKGCMVVTAAQGAP